MITNMKSVISEFKKKNTLLNIIKTGNRIYLSIYASHFLKLLGVFLKKLPNTTTGCSIITLYPFSANILANI